VDHIRYSIYIHGKTTNFVNAVSDLVWYIFIPPIEAIATIEGLDYSFAFVLNSKGDLAIYVGLIGVALMVAYTPFNYYGIKTFARITSVFGSIKYIIYAVAAIGVILAFTKPSNYFAHAKEAPHQQKEPLLRPT
jgi:amino acid transporter